MYKNPYLRLKPATREPYTEIYLIRHCHPDYSREKELGEYNMPLSAAGKRQRSYLTAKLLKLEIDTVYASGLLRAQETAASFVKKTGLEMIIENRLDEIDWKKWHRTKYFNMSESSRKKRFPFYAELDRKLDALQSEARRALAEIWRQNKGKRVALFTHGNLIKVMLTSVMNADVFGFLSFEIFQASVSKIIIDRDGYIKINYVNDATHLSHPPREDLFVTLID